MYPTAQTRVLRHFREGRGQSLVELAFVVPILLVLVFGIIDFSMGLRSYIALTNATREGARFAAVGNPAGAYPANCSGASNTTVVGRVCYTVDHLDLGDLQNVSVNFPNGLGPGNSVEVSAQYTYHYITPLGSLVHFFSGGAVSTTLNIHSKTTWRQE